MKYTLPNELVSSRVINYVIKEDGLELPKLSRRMGMNDYELQRILNQKALFSINQLKALADLHNLPSTVLLVKSHQNVELTPEQKEICERIRKEIKTLYPWME